LYNKNMTELLSKVSVGLVTILITVAGWIGYQAPPPDNLGIAIPTVVALFETSLASSITSSATSMTLVNGTTKDTSTLSGTYAFVIDEGTSSEEFVKASCTDTACTSMVRGISVIDGKTEVTALKKAHRRGATVKVTDYPQLSILSRILNGQESVPAMMYYSGAMDLSLASTSAIVHKSYVDNLAFIAGSPNATLTLQGISEMGTVAEINAGTGYGATGARLFVNPSYLASSNYASWLPTSSEKSALTYFNANYAATVSGKFIPFKLVASASGDMLIRDNDNYKNLPASKSAQQANVDSEALVLRSGIPTWGSTTEYGFRSGVTTRADSAGTGNQTITHAIGAKPKVIKMTFFALCGASGPKPAVSHGVYANGNDNSIAYQTAESTPYDPYTSAHFISCANNAGEVTYGDISAITSQSFTINWAAWSIYSSETAVMIWEAIR
jgi:hypothetical protein